MNQKIVPLEQWRRQGGDWGKESQFHPGDATAHEWSFGLYSYFHDTQLSRNNKLYQQIPYLNQLASYISRL